MTPKASNKYIEKNIEKVEKDNIYILQSASKSSILMKKLLCQPVLEFTLISTSHIQILIMFKQCSSENAAVMNIVMVVFLTVTIIIITIIKKKYLNNGCICYMYICLKKNT